jgi:hypothetical protein
MEAVIAALHDYYSDLVYGVAKQHSCPIDGSPRPPLKRATTATVQIALVPPLNACNWNGSLEGTRDAKFHGGSVRAEACGEEFRAFVGYRALRD